MGRTGGLSGTRVDVGLQKFKTQAPDSNALKEEGRRWALTCFVLLGAVISNMASITKAPLSSHLQQLHT